MLPYVDLNLSLPGFERSRLEYFSPETVAYEERYANSSRYRLNHWQPIIDTFPTATQKGLRFHHYREDPLVGMVSSFYVKTGEPSFTEIFVRSHKFIPPNPYVLGPNPPWQEIGVGFLRYSAPWWLPMDAMQFSIHRRVGWPIETRFRTFHQEGAMASPSMPIPVFSVATAGVSILFQLTTVGTKLHIHMTEYGLDGVTALNFATADLETFETDVPYRIVFFLRGSTDTEGYATLSATKFSTGLGLSPRETIYFVENPIEFKVPEANMRHARLPLIQQPHVAYIEDGSLELSSPMCQPIWFNLLKYLVSYTVEPCHYTDPFGNVWLCCLSDLHGTGPSNRRGQIRTGYTLTMPVLVMH